MIAPQSEQLGASACGLNEMTVARVVGSLVIFAIGAAAPLASGVASMMPTSRR